MNKIILLLFSVLCLMGRAQGNSVSSDRKLLGESVEIMDSITNRLLAEHPKVVLVTGDLTKDGERVSHQYLVDHFLSKLRRSGVRVFVIPGNHDVNNPHAVVFDGDKTRRTTTVSPSEFASIYADYGYGQALARDAASLSYVAQLAPGLRLIAIDACKYEENDFDKNICVTGGRIKPATQRFIREQADAAKKAGCKVVVMMHHGVVPHFSAQPVVLPEYLVDDYPAVGRMLRDCGADVVFTGHFHSQDIARDSTVTDVETGSLVSYPHPYRVIEVSGDKMSVTTHNLRSIKSLAAQGEDLCRSRRSLHASPWPRWPRATCRKTHRLQCMTPSLRWCPTPISTILRATSVPRKISSRRIAGWRSRFRPWRPRWLPCSTSS